MWVLLANNLFMIFYMITLLVKLKKYHYYEYNVQKVSIISFGLFETFFVLILVYYIGHRLFRWGMTWNQIRRILQIYGDSGLVPLL